MHRIITMISLLIISSWACSTISGVQSEADDLSQEDTTIRMTELARSSYPGFKIDSLGSFSATFEIRFEGSYTWTYMLEIVSNGQTKEYRMNYEGLSEREDPGEVRMVSDGFNSRMIGAGTDNECFIFPSDYDTDLPFFTPDDILDPLLANEGLREDGNDEVAGKRATHYSSENSKLGLWEDVAIDIWVDRLQDATLRYEMNADGEDPFFNAGRGQLSITFLINEIGEQSIQPITNCRIPVPLPEEATNIVKFPGLIAFNSTLSAQQMVTFYQTALPKEGWREASPVEIGEDAVLMSYQRGEEVMQINIELRDSGINVEILIQ